MKLITLVAAWLTVKIAKEKMLVHKIPDEKEAEFVKELHIAEGERYFHRDINQNPYWYNFRIDSQNYFPPNRSDKGDGLLVQACNLLIKTFDGLDWLPKDAKNIIEEIMTIEKDNY